MAEELPSQHFTTDLQIRRNEVDRFSDPSYEYTQPAPLRCPSRAERRFAFSLYSDCAA
jgi:hypothetical protein